MYVCTAKAHVKRRAGEHIRQRKAGANLQQSPLPPARSAVTHIIRPDVVLLLLLSSPPNPRRRPRGGARGGGGGVLRLDLGEVGSSTGAEGPASDDPATSELEERLPTGLAADSQGRPLWRTGFVRHPQLWHALLLADSCRQAGPVSQPRQFDGKDFDARGDGSNESVWVDSDVAPGVIGSHQRLVWPPGLGSASQDSTPRPRPTSTGPGPPALRTASPCRRDHCPCRVRAAAGPSLRCRGCT